LVVGINALDKLKAVAVDCPFPADNHRVGIVSVEEGKGRLAQYWGADAFRLFGIGFSTFSIILKIGAGKKLGTILQMQGDMAS